MILYLGIDLPEHYQDKRTIHYPIIKILPKPFSDICIQYALKEFSKYTHLLFTSKNAVRLFFQYAQKHGIPLDEIRKKTTLSVGQATAHMIRTLEGTVEVIAKNEHAEGLIEELKQIKFDEESYLFWPHSSLSRPILTDFFKERHLKYLDCIFYETVPNDLQPVPNINEIQEIVFTSPSTIEAFLKIFGEIPKNKTIHCIGPITEKHYRLLN